MVTREWLLARHAELEQKKIPEERIMRKIAKMLRPDEDDFHTAATTRDGTQAEVFDSTPLYALDDFGSGLYGQATNPATRWFEIGLDDPDLAKWKTVKDWLWATSSLIQASLSPSVASFYTEAPAWFADLGAFGLGVMSSEEAIGEGRIIDRTHAIRNVWIDVNGFGEVDTVHTRDAMSGRNVKSRFGEIEGVQDAAMVEVLHACFPNPDYKPGKLGAAGKRWLSIYFSKEHKGLWRVGGYHEFPYFVPMWQRRSGRVWPVGPGHKMHPDAGSLQELTRSNLVTAAFAADPVRAMHQGLDFRTIDFVPGALLRGAVSDDGKALVQPINFGGSLPVSIDIANELRKQIREAFYFSIFQVQNRPQMTATEVLAYQEERARQLGPHLARLQSGGLTPLIARRFRILERAGQLPPPPPELEGRSMAVTYISPLAKLQVVQQGRNVMNWIGALGQIAQATGRPDVLDNFDADAAALVMHDAMGVTPEVMKDQKKRDMEREGRAQMQAQQVALEGASQQSEIAANMAHAEQAGTLARQRREAA